MALGTSSCCATDSNDWSCFPDTPRLPGNDPTCYDPTWMDWNYAYLAGEEPAPAVPGFAYMLQGGSDASNTDPLATAPAAGEEWVSSGPHIMLLMPGELDQRVLDRSRLRWPVHHVGRHPLRAHHDAGG